MTKQITKTLKMKMKNEKEKNELLSFGARNFIFGTLNLPDFEYIIISPYL